MAAMTQTRGPRMVGLVNRQLPHYPPNSKRFLYLGITVLATVVLYYELYVGGAVAGQIITDFGFTFTGYVMVSVIGNLIGAFASLAAGLADRWGRANLVVYGLLITALIIGVGIPHAGSKTMFTVLFALLSLVEGAVLVATPALIRDFSPQVGRASAMGFWTLGPVLGSLIVTVVSSTTLDSFPEWRTQFYICGVVGGLAFLIALFTLKELTPGLRDQIMVSLHDRVLVEARAKNLDIDAISKNHWRQLIKLDVIGSAFAISIFLLMYYIFVGFFVLYMALTFGWSEAEANGLANWYWASNALALVAAGFLSDKLGVRKPLMIAGAAVSAIGTAVFATWATAETAPAYSSWVILLIIIAVGGGVAYTAWMASFTETVEKHNPAATATGLAIWGWIIRIVVTVALFVFGFALPAVSTIMDDGAKVERIATTYSAQLETVGALSPQTLEALQTAPNDPATGAAAVQELIDADVAATPAEAASRLEQLGTDPIPAEDAAFLTENGEAVVAAAADAPGQWERWWWICVAGQVLFIPAVFIMHGRWSPKKAREDAAKHEAYIQAELAKLNSGALSADEPVEQELNELQVSERDDDDLRELEEDGVKV